MSNSVSHSLKRSAAVNLTVSLGLNPVTQELSHSSPAHCSVLPSLQITQRERNVKTAGKNEGVKIREEKKKGGGGMFLFTVTSHTHQNEGLISEKHSDTTRSQTEPTVWRPAHEDESTHMQRLPCRGVRADYEIRGNTEQNGAEPSLPVEKQQAGREANSAEASVTSLPSAHETDCVITASGQRGWLTPRGSSRGGVVDAALISAPHEEHTLPSDCSLLPSQRLNNSLATHGRNCWWRRRPTGTL